MPGDLLTQGAITAAKAVNTQQLQDQQRFHQPACTGQDTDKGGIILAQPARASKKQLLAVLAGAGTLVILLALRAFGVI